MKKCYVIALLLTVGCTTPIEQKLINQAIEGTDITIEMMPVQSGDGYFWISQTEVTWDLYDIFLQFINSPDNLHAGVDAVTLPERLEPPGIPLAAGDQVHSRPVP